MSKYKYDVEIDVQDYSIDGPFWRNYGTLISQGNSLEELLDKATVDIIDQDGGEVAVVAADSEWMQDLIEEEFYRKYGQSTGGGSNALVGFIAGLLIAVNVHAMVDKQILFNSTCINGCQVMQVESDKWCLQTSYGLRLCTFETFSDCFSAYQNMNIQAICVKGDE